MLSPSTALKRPNAVGWKLAAQTELDQFVENGGYFVERPPDGEKAVPCMSVLTMPEKPVVNADGVTELKATERLRIVTAGNLTDGYTKEETYAPTPGMSTINVFFSLLVCFCIFNAHFDVSQAFSQGNWLERLICVLLPRGLCDPRGVSSPEGLDLAVLRAR